MKFRIRDDEKGEFEVQSVQRIDATTRSFIAKAFTIAGLFVLVGASVYFAFTGNASELKAIATSMTPLLCFVLGYYFKSSDG